LRQSKNQNRNMDIAQEGGNQSIQALLCMVPLQGNHSLWFLVGSNAILAITSTFCNAVIVAALSRGSCIHPPSKILLRSLALTDFCVGFLLDPLFVMFLISIEYKHWNLCTQITLAVLVAGQVLCTLSLFTLTAISVDRLLALLLGIRYRQVVTFKRVLLVVICFWALIISLAMVVFWDYQFSLYYNSIAVLLCAVTTTCCYTKIYQKLHHHQIHVHQGQPNGHAPLNIARYRKTVSNALWVQLTLVTCYLPAGTVVALIAIKGITPDLCLAWTFLVTVVHLNSTLNPILYCLKIGEVRRAVAEILRQTLCLSN